MKKLGQSFFILLFFGTIGLALYACYVTYFS